MNQAYSNDAIANIFIEIDKDKDGLISRQDFEGTDYVNVLFEGIDMPLNALNTFPDGKINLKDFTLLVHANRYKLIGLAVYKFQAEKYINKYLSVSAPGEAAPSLKQSYLKLKAHNASIKEEKLHSFGIEFGVDKPHQQAKIKEVQQVLGHPLHQVFLLIKFSTPKNGEQIANKLQELIANVLQILKGLAPELSDQGIIQGLKPYAKYANNYVYVVVEVDNPLVDGLISFATEVCAFKFKANLQSNLNNLLTEGFDYTKSGGEASIQFDIDHVTLKKIKEILGDNVNEGQNPTPPRQLISLLLQEVKISTEFSNLGEAITSTLNIEANQIPKPYSQLQVIKELSIKQTLGQFYEGGPNLLELISNSSQGQGEISINFHDFFFKISYDVHIEKAFELLG